MIINILRVAVGKKNPKMFVLLRIFACECAPKKKIKHQPSVPAIAAGVTHPSLLMSMAATA